MVKQVLIIKSSVVFLILSFLTCSFGQISEYGIPESIASQKLVANDIPIYNFILSQDEIPYSNDSTSGIGKAEFVDIDFIESAARTISNDIEIYRININVKNTLAIGVDFSEFYLPKKGKIFMYDDSQRVVLGPYSNKNSNKFGKFSILPIPGQSVILEYNGPTNSDDEVKIRIQRIAKIYKPIFSNQLSSKSISCNVDVHCVPNLEVERSVIKISYYDTDDEKFKTGSAFLVNQDVTANNLKPYVLTAEHCIDNTDLSEMTFLFNYQGEDCDELGGSQYFEMTGCSLIANRSLYDMAIVELLEFPPPEFNVHLAGWDRNEYSNLDEDMLCIHHIHGYQKMASLGTIQSNINPYFWRFSADRNDSPINTGSSGSPLFEDEDDRSIGWAASGTSDCEDPDDIIRFGKLRKGWDSSSSTSRLKDWLDPNDNNETYIDGRDPCFSNITISDATLYPAADTYQPENRVVIQASSSIETSGEVIILPFSDYVFKAGQSIILNPGFKTMFSTSFIAIIGECSQIAAE